MDVCRIVAQYRDAYRVSTSSGDRHAVLAGRLRHQTTHGSELPAVGDFVEVRPPERDGPVIIEAVLPRKTLLVRRAAGDRPDDQVIAANIDVVFVVVGLDLDFNIRRVERYLAAVWESGATPVVLLIHGGGWVNGDKTSYGATMIDPFLKEGISVAAINYRFTQHAPYPAPMLDSARAIQFLRSKAGDWNLDPKRVAASRSVAHCGPATSGRQRTRRRPSTTAWCT